MRDKKKTLFIYNHLKRRHCIERHKNTTLQNKRENKYSKLGNGYVVTTSAVTMSTPEKQGTHAILTTNAPRP